MNTEVRRAETGDARAIARIHSSSWRVTYKGILPSSYLRSLDPDSLAKRWDSKLRHPSPGAERVLVADHGGRVVGFASFGAARDEDDPGFAGELHMLYVEPFLERAGVGRSLIEAATQSLVIAGYRWMAIWVVEANEAARRFYQASGFDLDGARRDDRIGGGRTPVVRMGKPIGEQVRFLPLAKPN